MGFTQTSTRPYLMGDLTADSRPQMLQERSKRKSDLDTPDESLPPRFKRRTLARSYAISDLAADSQPPKRKPDSDSPDDSLPPSFKRCTLTRSYVISDLAADSRPKLLQSSKRKPDSDSPDDSFPPSFKQRTLARSIDITCTVTRPSAISNHAVQTRPAVYYSADPVPLHVSLPADFAGCGTPTSCWPFPNELILMIFEQLPVIFSFHGPPRRADVAASDRNLTALKVFLEALRGRVDLASLFHLIKDLGCSSFRYSSIQAEYPCTMVANLVPQSDPGENSPITDLSLTHVALSGIQWATLLQNVHLPLLHMLSVDVECPTAALGVLGGPPWYLLALLEKVHPAHSIRHLSVRFEEDSTTFNPNYLSAILDITRHFTVIQELQLNFYGVAHPSDHFDVLVDECRTVPVKNLAISTHCGDDIFAAKC
ncbi:uncharacterized protein EDB91DRAFT_1084080 [Suillus paluster]|uniref:uncharacterized protein n=1 Tax=Suillus paluster TaxID=48578 RepID=UPI001B87EDFC|nr:uncharacterized protein EDB91DRAFT_1084080 [Suillus paluster]KAG1734423.1 hypothetical protein EDB91DRAFT_1084080 [Suillus paluster]